MNEMIQNTVELRSLNRKKILSFLRIAGQATKKDIAEALDLSFATVSNLGNQLMEEGFLQISAWQNSLGGRNSGLLSLNLGTKYFLGLNIANPDIIEVAIMNLRNEKVLSRLYAAPESFGLDALIGRYRECAAEILQEAGVEPASLLGLGVAVPGIINKGNGRLLNSTNKALEDQPILLELGDAFGMPVYAENESNLLALAASLCGHERDPLRDVVFIYMEQGLGIGIICNGQLVTGRTGFGGEVNHFPLGYRGYECWCGHRGCVETELTMAGFLKKYAQESGRDIACSEKAWNAFIDAVKAGDAGAIAVLKENGTLLGMLCAMTASIFEPEAIFIGGITDAIFDSIQPHIVREFKDRAVLEPVRNIAIGSNVSFRELIFQGCGELVYENWNP
jgi:N-acetylglucosamine repressor